MADEEKKKKKVQAVLIEKEADIQSKQMYRLLDEVIQDHRPDLADAEVQIALAWRHGWKADAFGRVPFGKSKIHSELDRQLSHFDGAIEINHEVWHAANFSDEQKRALLHHYLCSFVVATDNDDDPKVNEQGRVVLKKRNPDAAVFEDNVVLFGLWHEKLRRTYEAAKEANDKPLLEGLDKVASVQKKGAKSSKAKVAHQA